MSASVAQHQVDNSYHAPQKFVSPFLDETSSNTSAPLNGGMSSPQIGGAAHQNANQGMGSLRAASHVSMEGTPSAHEYSPICACQDCQSLLRDFTDYTIMAAYVSNHLPYEAMLEKTYGFVPCRYGPFGNIAVRLDPATGAPAEGAAPETSEALFFFSHNATQRPVLKEVRDRSLRQFYASMAAGGSHQQQQPAVPAPASYGNHQRRYNNNNGAYSRAGNNGGYQQAQRGYAMKNQFYQNVGQFADYNNGGAHHYATSAAANRQFYTAADMQAVESHVGFNNYDARLGQ